MSFFIDTGTWPCSRTFFERSKDYLKNMTKPSIGLTVRQKKCYMDLKKDEKEFRNALIENDDKYYSMSGLLYKTLTHVLSIVFKSNLPINGNNIHKIIKENPYFKGFSDESYNLYKTKDSPEFLSIYKYQFKKYLTIEKVSIEILVKIIRFGSQTDSSHGRSEHMKVNTDKVSASAKKNKVGFVFNVIDDINKKTTNTVSVEDSSFLIQRLEQLSKDAVGTKQNIGFEDQGEFDNPTI